MCCRRLFIRVAAALVFHYGPLTAEVTHVRDYRTQEPTDKNVLFAMAVTPDGDALSLVAKASGRWRLTRIHGWVDKKPSEQTIDIPGWPAERDAAKAPVLLNANLFVTADGRYAVCAAHGAWVGRGGDDLVSVVDLHTFGIVKTIRTSEVGQENRTLFVDPYGHLVLHASTSIGRSSLAPSTIGLNGLPTSRVPQQESTLVVLALPDLGIQGQCGDPVDQDQACAACWGEPQAILFHSGSISTAWRMAMEFQCTGSFPDNPVQLHVQHPITALRLNSARSIT